MYLYSCIVLALYFQRFQMIYADNNETVAENEEAIRQFKITVEKTQSGCGGLLVDSFGSIQSPNYPNQYESNVECVWIIKTAVGYHINFTFADTFDITPTVNCREDYLLFEESLSQDLNNWSTIAKYCGHRRPQSLQSKDNIVRVTFHTNPDNTGIGFNISYRKSCDKVFTAESGVISSPNFPNKYDNSISCEYLIQRNPNDYIYLQFESDFQLENGQSCVWDKLDIYLGNNKSAKHLGPYCGNDIPPPLVSNAALLVTFKTDGSLTGRGFKAFYNITSCGGNLTQPFGEIYNPGYPLDYMPNLNCIWTITVDENRVIELRFDWLHLLFICTIGFERPPQCSINNIEIRDVYNDTSNWLGTFPNRNHPIIKSRGNQLWIELRTDTLNALNTQNGRGFKMVYRETLGEAQGCGGVYVNVSNGVIQSPDIDNDGNYENNIDCQWSIIVADNQRVKLSFQEMDIEQSPVNMTECSNDYVELRDGISVHRTLGIISLNTRYCGTTLPSSIITASNHVTISFHSDSRQTRKGFRLAFESLESICQNIELKGTNAMQTISSVSYPHAYNSSLRCTWSFISPEKRIQFAFNDFDIDCSNNDTIIFTSRFRDFKIASFAMCGRIAPPMIMIDNSLQLTYISNNRPVNNSSGFSLNYTLSKCNMSLTSDSGYLQSTYFSNRFRNRREKYCQINITAPIGYTISLYFNNFTFDQTRFVGESWSGCIRSNMTIRDGVQPNSPLIATLCGNALPDPIFSHSNQLSIDVNNFDDRFSHQYFISYTTTNAGRGCGGNLTAFYGTFTSPLYPQPYNESVECKWFIHSFGLHTLSLGFSYFSLSSAVGCDTNYLEIYDGLDELSSNKIIRLCGRDQTGRYKSQGNGMMIKLVTNENNTKPGFIAHYSHNSFSEFKWSKQILTSSLWEHIGHIDPRFHKPIMLGNRNNIIGNISGKN